MLALDYPYCLVSKELRGIIRSLLGRASTVLELFFDHCVYTMLQELDKSPGEMRPGHLLWAPVVPRLCDHGDAAAPRCLF